MKKFSFLFITLLITWLSEAQVLYFKGEWTIENKTDLFTCLCKLEIKNRDVTAEFIWTYIAIDSTNAEMTEWYKNKKGKTGVEYTSGTYNPVSGDIYLIATSLDDPHEILGMTKYRLKFSIDKKAIYGTTTSIEDENPGLFYATVIKNSRGTKDFMGLKKSVK